MKPTTAGGHPLPGFECMATAGHVVGDPSHGLQRMTHHIATVAMANRLPIHISRAGGLPQQIELRFVDTVAQHHAVIPGVFSHQAEKMFFQIGIHRITVIGDF